MATTAVTEAVERYVQLRDVRARFLEAGQGTPTICIHGVGFTAGAESWLPAIRAGLADHLHIMALDNIGWGAGDRPTFEYSISYFVDFIRELQDALGFAKTNLIGHSLGGWIAGTFAYESPDRVHRLVLDDSAGMNPEPPAAVANFQPPTEEGLRKQIEGTFEDPEMRLQQFEAQWRNANVPDGEAAFRQINRHLNDPAMRSRYFLGRRLGNIRVPTLVVWGEHGNALFPQNVGRDIASRISGAKLVVVPGAGHFTPQQKPAEFVAAVNAFLD
jgi:pimeloyl-ACP methyl ester carboxylesterase